MCVKGATRSWFADNTSPPFQDICIPKEELATHQQIFDPKNGGYGPGLNWYKAQIANLNTEEDTSIPPERRHIQQRTLAILGRDDFICVPAMQEATMRPYVKNLKVETVDAGHWVQLQQPDETNKLLKEFFDEAVEEKIEN